MRRRPERSFRGASSRLGLGLLGTLVVVTTWLAIPPPAAAQDWGGEGRAHGVVLDDDGRPVAGATVTLHPQDEPTEGPAPATTGADGKWSELRLGGGVWTITIEAKGFLPARGFVRVDEEETPAPLEVRLQSIDVVTPAFWEGSPLTLKVWVEKGDALLAQGRPADAREEYRKAVQAPGGLSDADRAQVLEQIARTHFLEGDGAKAERALEASLVLAPGSDRTRQLLTTLAGQAGRGDEARRFLARLAKDPKGVAAELSDLLGQDKPLAEKLHLREEPVVPAMPGRMGSFRTAFTERSSLSSIDVFVKRFGGTLDAVRKVDPTGGRYDLAKETFEVYVPGDYRARSQAEVAAGGASPWGLVVWVSPGSSGGPDDTGVEASLDRRHLLWVGANSASNVRPAWDRVDLALDAAANMARLYDLDPERIYVAGYSGGGRLASEIAMLYPEVFRGEISWFGCNYFRDVPIPDRPGTHWSADFPAPPDLARLRRESRFVLVTGEVDFNRLQTGAYYRAMKKDGFRRVTYLQIPGASHYVGLGSEWFGKALDALDAPDGGGS